jgi:hypothetical protein
LRRQIDLWQLGDRVAPIIGADSDAQQQNTSEYGAARGTQSGNPLPVLPLGTDQRAKSKSSA